MHAGTNKFSMPVLISFGLRTTRAVIFHCLYSNSNYTSIKCFLNCTIIIFLYLIVGKKYLIDANKRAKSRFNYQIGFKNKMVQYKILTGCWRQNNSREYSFSTRADMFKEPSKRNMSVQVRQNKIVQSSSGACAFPPDTPDFTVATPTHKIL